MIADVERVFKSQPSLRDETDLIDYVAQCGTGVVPGLHVSLLVFGLTDVNRVFVEELLI
mgnify:CR=1 FL=1